MRNRSGFTLIEILVVVAISVLLFGLLFAPMIASFNLTRQGRVRIEAQDAARLNLERISREMSGAMYIYDNSVSILIMGPNDTAATGPRVTLPYGKIDLVMPRMLMHCNNPAHDVAAGPRDYERDTDDPNWPGEEAWPPCPVCQSPDYVTARPIQPMIPSRRVVRYFVGLMDPTLPYNNVYENPTAAGENNTYVLYRAEFSPWNSNLIPQTANGPDLNNPDFFYNPVYSAEWKRISRIVGPVKDVNLVAFTSGGSVANSSVRFTPTAIENDAMSPTYLNDIDSEMPAANQDGDPQAPTVFRAAHGLWTPDYHVFIYRTDFSSVYYTAPSGGDMWLWLYNAGAPIMVFNISDYQRTGGFNFGTAIDDQKLLLDIEEKTGEVRFAFAAPELAFLTNDINGNGGLCQLPLSNWGPRAKVVPGTEEIKGPDQTPIRWPGQAAGDPPRRVRYTRVPLALGTPGLNQYKIDYDTAGFWFPSAPGEQLPADLEVIVNYKFHNNISGDIVRADYTTKNLITVTFGSRIFDAMSRKMFTTELTNKVRVRNTIR